MVWKFRLLHIFYTPQGAAHTMTKLQTSRLVKIISESAKILLADWIALCAASPDPRVSAQELEAQCESIIASLVQGCRGGNLTDIEAPAFAPLRDIIVDLSLTR